MCKGSASSFTFGKLTLGRRLGKGPNGRSKVLSGDRVTFSWHLAFPPHPVQLPCLGSRLCSQPTEDHCPGPSALAQFGRSSVIFCLLLPLYSSGICYSNLTVIYITLKPSKCSLYLHLNICQIVFFSLQLKVRRSCIKSEKWKSRGLISEQWYLDCHSCGGKALCWWTCQIAVCSTAVQFHIGKHNEI